MFFLFERWNGVISCCIDSKRQTRLNNYTEEDDNQQSPDWKKAQTFLSSNCWQLPPSWSPCIMLIVVLCSQGERWQINSISPWKGATVSVDEEQFSKRRGNQQDGVIWAWARGSGWQTSEQSHPMIFYALLKGVNLFFCCSGGALQPLSAETPVGGGVNN